MTSERNDTIAAVATGTGGAVALIRISGERAVPIGDVLFRNIQGKPLSTQKGYTIHYGTIRDGETVIDEVLVSLFRAPHSYTGEDRIEISCHASDYILRRVMELAIRHGARTARPGEFTLRAFLAGKMDLSQAKPSQTSSRPTTAPHTIWRSDKCEEATRTSSANSGKNSYISYLYSSWNWTSAKKT